MAMVYYHYNIDAFLQHLYQINIPRETNMNYVPVWLHLIKTPKTIEQNGKSSRNIDKVIEKADSTEHKLSVSTTDTNLFETQDQISVSDVPSDQRKKNSFYRWFRRKLWCITRSKSVDSGRLRKSSRRRNKLVKNSSDEIKPPIKIPKPIPEPDQDPYGPEVGVQRPTTTKTPMTSVKNIQETPEGVIPPKERQVTFSDTVKTHIKTKYVTAEEYQQIRGLSMNNHRILYQYNNENLESKEVKLSGINKVI